jgi:hypothetical protein
VNAPVAWTVERPCGVEAAAVVVVADDELDELELLAVEPPRLLAAVDPVLVALELLEEDPQATSAGPRARQATTRKRRGWFMGRTQ